MSKAKNKSAAPSETKKRTSNLTAEERKARASLAAKAMWEKRKAAKQAAAQEHPTDAKKQEVPAPPPEPPAPTRKITVSPVPKEFSRALAVATKHYEKALEDLTYHQEMVAMLTAKIPGLVQMIRALGGVVSGVAETPNGMAMRGPEINYPPPENLPVIPVARGGSMGVINDAKTAEDENQFLRDAEGVGAGGGWA